VLGDWSKSQALYERALDAGVAQASQRICHMRSQHEARTASPSPQTCGLGETP
jgi:hypothetical protein